MLSRISPNGVGVHAHRFPADGLRRRPLDRLHDGYLSAVTSDSDGRTSAFTRSRTARRSRAGCLIRQRVLQDPGGVCAAPSHMSVGSADPFVVGGKLYLIVYADGIGDVYQIRTDDTVNIAFQGTAGAVDGNAPARTAGDVFYGDAVKLRGR